MREADCPNTGERCIRLKDKYNQIPNAQVLIFAESGHGKTLTIESIAEKLHEHKYICFFLTDAKGKFEFAFPLFEPEAEYHLEGLHRQHDKKQRKKVVIHHPFTFNLPTDKKHPPMNIFTIPKSWITREPLQFLFETEYDTTPIKMFLSELQRSTPGMTLHEILYKIERRARRKTKKDGDISDINFKGFGTHIETSGTIKEVKELYGVFEPFLHDFMIMPDDFPLNLDLKSIFRDQESYHVLSTKYIKDKKMRLFITFMWIYAILEYRDLCSSPVCLVLDEIPQLAPHRAAGCQSIMANKLMELAIARSKGQGGIFSLLGSQFWGRVDERVVSNATEIFIGKITNLGDQEKLKKVIGSYIGDIVQSLPKGVYVRKGDSRRKMLRYRSLFPKHGHAEQHEDFRKKYRKEFPEKEIVFDETVKMMKKTLKHQERIKTLREKAHSKEMEEKAEKEKEKEQVQQEKQKKDQNKASKAEEKLKELLDSEIQRRDTMIVNMKDMENAGYGKIAEKIEEIFAKEYHVSRERVGQIYRKSKREQKASVIVDNAKTVLKGPLEEPRDTAD